MFKPNTEYRSLDFGDSLESSGIEVAPSRLIRCKFASRRTYLDFSRQFLPLRIRPRTCGKITPAATDSRSQPELLHQRAASLCLCREPEGAGAGGGEAPFRGPIQGMWSREVAGGIPCGEGPELIGCV